MVAQVELAQPARECIGGCRCPCHEDHHAAPHALNHDLLYLTAIESRLFDELFDELGDWVGKATVSVAVWGYADQSEQHTLTVHLSRLRRKLIEHQAPWRIDSKNGSAGGPGALRLMALDSSA